VVVAVVLDIYDIVVVDLPELLDNVFLRLEVGIVELEDAILAVKGKEEYLCLAGGLGDYPLILIGNGVENKGVTSIGGHPG